MHWGFHVTINSIFSNLRYVTANAQRRLSLYCWDQEIFYLWLKRMAVRNTACGAFCIYLYFPVSLKVWQSILDINYFFCLFTQEFESLTKYVSCLKHSCRNKPKILHIKLKETFNNFFFCFVIFFTLTQWCFKRRCPASFKALNSCVLFVTFYIGTRKSNQWKV